MGHLHRTTPLAAAALGLLLTLPGCGSDGSGSGSDPVARGVTSAPTPTAAPTPAATPTAPATPPAPAAPAAVPDGTYDVHVLAAEGGGLVLDRGRFVVGEPVEPGVDSTAPIRFDTGASQERASARVADDARLVLQVAGTGAAEVSYEELAAAVEASTSPFLATAEVVGGEVVALEELYRA